MRRIKSTRPGDPAMIASTLVFGTTALVVIEDPSVTVLVDATRRTVGRPRSLPRCP